MFMTINICDSRIVINIVQFEMGFYDKIVCLPTSPRYALAVACLCVLVILVIVGTFVDWNHFLGLIALIGVGYIIYNVVSSAPSCFASNVVNAVSAPPVQ